jgi:methyltransferase (TIGR00027 family)
MISAQPSRTAMRVAMRRAAHQLLDDPLVFDDPLAIPILGREMAAAVRADPGQFEKGRLSSYMRAFFAARSRFAEDQLAAARAAGVQQYVILGAGLDTFAYRDPSPALPLRVWEVDHPATQAWKRERLAESAIPVPGNLTFAPADFERDICLMSSRRRDSTPRPARSFRGSAWCRTSNGALSWPRWRRWCR